jgi:hypothetical protein
MRVQNHGPELGIRQVKDCCSTVVVVVVVKKDERSNKCGKKYPQNDA